jgi:peptidoglycan-N-acetylglucosamine deacetylase
MSTVALTFDDGPDPRGTPAVLDALSRAGARATFFVLGEQVERRGDLLARTLADGHRVELHGHAHLRHTEHPRAAIEADLRAALAALDAAGVQPSLWRLPWGAAADFSVALAAEHGLRLAGWTADSHDWRGDAAPAMLAALEPQLAPGAIVLAHDGVGIGALRADCAQTAALVESLVAALRARGLEPGAPAGTLPIGNPDFG